MKGSVGFRKSPFQPEKMRLVAPKGVCARLAFTTKYSCQISHIYSYVVPYQDNGCDCGVFVCRYAINLYLMRKQIFSFSGIENQFKKLITDGAAFDFDMDDIARIREEIKDLIDALSPLYYASKRQEKSQRAAAKSKGQESPPQDKLTIECPSAPMGPIWLNPILRGSKSSALNVSAGGTLKEGGGSGTKAILSMLSSTPPRVQQFLLPNAIVAHTTW
jgi:hypothetical protein